MVLLRVVVMGVCVRMSLRRLECRSASLSMLDGVSFFFPRSWGQVLTPPTGGSVSVNIMYGVLCPSTTLRAAVFDSSLCVTPVCDSTLPMCVFCIPCYLLCGCCRLQVVRGACVGGG
jgi:hypothetical protein